MSKLSFEKGQKIAKVFHEDPIKNEILKIVIKKLMKKHLKGGVTDNDLIRAYNDSADQPHLFPQYLLLKELYDKERKPKKIAAPTPKFRAPIAVEPVIYDIIEEREKEEIKELRVKVEELKELRKAVPPMVPRARIEITKRDLSAKKEELKEKRDEIYDISEILRRVDDDGNFFVDDEDQRNEMEATAFALRAQIDILKDLIQEDEKELRETEERDRRLEESSNLIDKELKQIQAKLKTKEDLKQKLNEKTESKRKQLQESVNTEKLRLKQKKLFPNIEQLRNERSPSQDLVKLKSRNKKKNV